jgi:hypothetical protein
MSRGKQQTEVRDAFAQPLVDPQNRFFFAFVGAACDEKQVVAE